MKLHTPYSGQLVLLFVLLTFTQSMWAKPALKNSDQTGTTRYVAPTGSDNNPGTLAAPFATIQHAANLAAPGDTIYVREGTYSEAVIVRHSGTAENPITFAAYPGENPVIDGQYALPPVPSYGWGGCNNSVSPPKCFHYSGLVWLRGDHIRFEGFEVKRSLGRGIVVQRDNGIPTDVIIRRNAVHDLRSSALVILQSDDVLVEENEFYHAGDYATPDRSSSSLSWPVAVNAIDATNIVYKNNLIFRNWGEGISTGRDSVDIHILDNIVYDNFALNIYIHRSHHVNVSGNLVYCTNDPEFHRSGNPPPGVIINNENSFSGSLTVNGVNITNNMVTGCRQNFAFWSQGTERARNVMITHNTFVNATSNPGKTDAMGVSFPVGTYENVQFTNNIVSQSAFSLGWSAESSGVTLRSNLWSDTPHSSLSGSGDVIGDPQFANGNGVLQPGLVQAEWFKLQPGSPAIDAGLFVGQLADFFGNQRGLSPDIGMHEHPNGIIGLLEEQQFLPAVLTP